MAWDPKSPTPVEFPAALAGMVAHENRLLTDPSELLSAEGVAMDDLVIRKEPGLAAYDVSGLAIAPTFTATLSASRAWDAAILALKTQPSSTPLWVRTVGTDADSQNTVTSITLTVTVAGAAVPVGNFLVLPIAASDDFPTTVTVSDTRSNTYVQSLTNADLTNQSAQLLSVYTCKVTTQLEIGDVITIAFTGLVSNPVDTSCVAVVEEFSGIADQPSVDTFGSAGSAGSTAVSVSTSSPVADVPEMLVGIAWVYIDTSVGGDVTVTGGSAFTDRGEVANTPATDVNALRLAVSTKIFAEEPTIVALTDWYSDAAPNGAGTVSTSAGDTTVTGAGTTFTNHAPGDRIVIDNETRIIETITSNTVLDTTTSWVKSNSGATYYTRIGNRIITATSGGNLFKEKPLTLTTGNIDAVLLKSGLSQSARPGRFVAAGKEAAALDRKLFYMNGVDPVQVLSGDGTSTTAIATPPLDWDTVANEGEQPINGVVHQNRLVLFGNLNDPHRAYFSDPDDHEDFTSVESFDIRFRSDIGDRLFGAVSFQGILFFCKYPRGVFYLDDTSLTATEWVIRPKSESIGCAPTPYAMLSIDDDVLILDPNAHFHLLSAVDAFGGARASDVTLRLGLSKWTRDNVNLKLLSRAVSYWYPQKKLAVFYVPGTGDEENTLAIKFDFSGRERDLPVKVSFSRRDTAGGVAVRRATDGGPETPIIGEGAFVYLADQEARNKNGLGYTMSYRLPNTDLAHVDGSLRAKKKRPEHLELIMEPVEEGTLTVDVLVDGVIKQTLTYDATKTREKRSLNVGSGWTFSINVSNSIANHDCKVLSHVFYFGLGDESYAVGERSVGLSSA